MVLPSYYLEIVLCSDVASIATVVVYRGGFLKVLFESFSKGPKGLSNVFLITHNVPTFVSYGVLILGGNQEIFNGAFTPEVGLYAILTEDLFNAFV